MTDDPAPHAPRLMDTVAHLVADLATATKAGTIHEQHEGWSWNYPDRRLMCSCGDVLVDPS